MNGQRNELTIEKKQTKRYIHIQLMIDYKNESINTKMVTYMQINFKEALAYKSLLCKHMNKKLL